MFGLGHAAVADAAIADLFCASGLLFYLDALGIGKQP